MKMEANVTKQAIRKEGKCAQLDIKYFVKNKSFI